MNQLIVELAGYIFEKYPNPHQLSKPRLVKLLYLMDWKSAIDHDRQITSIRWFFNHYGPYVEDVVTILKAANKEFKVTSYKNPFNHGVTDRFELIIHKEWDITNEAKRILDLLILHTSKMNWSEFIGLVYNTFPIRTNSKYTYLDLVNDARLYKSEIAPANKR